LTSPTRSVPHDPDTFFRSYVPESFAPIAAKLGAVTSPGAVVFRVGERAPIAIRLSAGTLAIAEGLPADSIVQVSLSEADFEPILVRGTEMIHELGSGASPDRQLAVLKALTLDRERVDQIRLVQGSVAFVLAAEGAEHRVVLTPGSVTPNLSASECTVRCAISDFLAMQRGSANPFELMMNGKIQISGNAQIPMALSALLV
jgi:putative sterol carrier protein